MRSTGTSGITTRFQELFRCTGQVGHALLTRSPLSPRPKPGIPFDLHVLSTPPAFILSQNRTLHKKTLRKESEKQTLKNKKDENILKEGHSHKTPPQFNPTKGTHQKAGLQRTGNH